VLEKIKYPALVLSFATGNAVGLGTKLGLLNLPLGIAVAGIGFGAAIVGGIVHAPKTAPGSALPENATAKKSPVKSVVNGVENWVKFLLDTVKTPGYVVGASAAQGGYNLLFQAAMGIGACATAATLSPVLAPLAIAGCVALAGASLFTIAGGIDEQFKGIGKFYNNRFNKNAPDDPSKQNLIQKFAASPSVQNFSQQPVVQIFLDSKAVKALRKGLSPKAKKILLTCMSVETSIFSLSAAVSVLMSGPAVIPLAIAGVWAASSSWGMIQAARNADVLKYVSRLAGKKEAAVTDSAPAAQLALAPAAVPDAVSQSLFTKFTDPLTNMFKRNADKEGADGNAPLQPVVAAQNARFDQRLVSASRGQASQ